MDTNIGIIEGVTNKKVANSKRLHTENILGFGAIGDQVVVVSKNPLSKQEIDQLKVDLAQSPEIDPAEEKKQLDLTAAIDKVASTAKLSADEKTALKEGSKIKRETTLGDLR